MPFKFACAVQNVAPEILFIKKQCKFYFKVYSWDNSSNQSHDSEISVSYVVITLSNINQTFSLDSPDRQNFSSLSSPEPETKHVGVHSRPLDSDDLRMIEEDLSKQLGSSPRDLEWDAEPNLEPFVTGFENGGKQRCLGQLFICQPEIYDDQEACKI